MAYVLAVLPGVGLDQLDRMGLAELGRWVERAARFDRQRNGPPK
ncbi:hypothetical protein [Phenylobacterium sp.]